jgi:hypothetical protein
MPTTTTGVATSFIDFTRASNATVTDSDGLVKWAPHNLLTNSESFDAASWAKSSVTPTANSIAAPNGTTTADTLAASGANGTTLQTFTAEAISYTFAVWLKRKTGTGNIQIAADSGTYTTVTITSDWALYTVTQTPAAGSKSAGIRIVTSADEVYAWGASLYRSDLAMQPNTSAYPLYNPTTPKNLLGYTQDFSNAAWTKGNLVTTGMANVTATTDPLGLYTADKLQETATTAEHYILQSVTLTAAQYTLSVYLKAAERTWAIIQFSTGGLEATWFNLAPDGSGVPGTVAAGCAAASIYVGNGWYRCSVTRTATAATWYGVVNPSLGNGISPIYAGTLNSGIYIWGAQLSDSASLDSYVPVYGAAVTSAAYYGPRRDFDGATLACKGLLVEEQRSNLLLYSNTFTNGAWSPNGIASTTADVTGPDGVANSAFTITDSNTGNLGYRLQTVTVPNNSLAYTGSVYVKKTTGASTFPGVGFLYSGGTTVSAEYTLNTDTGVAVARIGNAGTSSAVVQNDGGFWRIEITATNNNTGNTSAALFVAPAVNSDGSGTWSAATIGSAVFYGAQLEVGASNAAAPFATSYIPTGSASATRNADVASVSTQAFPYSANEGTLVANGSPLSSVANTTQVIAELGDAGATNIFEIYRVSGGTNGALYVASGGVGSTITVSNAFPANAASKFGGVYKVNDFQAAANGTLGTPVTSGAVPTAASNLYIGKYGGATNVMWNGHIRQITYLPRRITNAELQTRTT